MGEKEQQTTGKQVPPPVPDGPIKTLTCPKCQTSSVYRLGVGLEQGHVFLVMECQRCKIVLVILDLPAGTLTVKKHDDHPSGN